MELDDIVHKIKIYLVVLMLCLNVSFFAFFFTRLILMF